MKLLKYLFILLSVSAFAQNRLDLSARMGTHQDGYATFPMEARYNVDLFPGYTPDLYLSTSIVWQVSQTVDYRIYPRLGLTKGVVNQDGITVLMLSGGFEFQDRDIVWDDFARLSKNILWRPRTFARLDVTVYKGALLSFDIDKDKFSIGFGLNIL